MTPIRFPSVLNPDKVGYEWTNDSMTFWDTAYHNAGVLHCSAGFYETLGDGNCQHAPLMACRTNQLTDFCLSLTRFLLANPTTEFYIGSGTFEPLPAEGVMFLTGINYRDDKRQWFNLSDRKVSSAESRQHDKRWFQVPTWADGTVASAVGLFNLSLGENHREMESLKVFALHEYFLSTVAGQIWQGKDWERMTAYQTQIPGDFAAAFRALAYVVKARDMMDTARRTADCCEHNSRRTQEQAA